jgi:hypothetical protein
MAFLTDQLVKNLADAINGSDRAQEELQRKGRQELVMVHDSIRYDDDSALEWLHENGYDEWGLFVTAVYGDPHAVQALFDGKQSRMAMAAHAVLGDTRSMEWLQKNNHKAWIQLVEAIKKSLAEDE